jgi:hypothetical protein
MKNQLHQFTSYIDKGRKIQKQGNKIDNELNQFSKQYLLTDVSN